MPGYACRPGIAVGCLAAWVAITGAVACGGTPGADERAAEAPRTDANHAGDVRAPLEISEDAQQSAGMRIVTAEHRELPVPMEVTGFVTPDTTRVMRVRALAEGVISRVDVKLGDRVRAEQPLIEYDNIALGDHIAEYRAAVAARRQAEADLEVRRRSFERAEQLIAVEAIAQQTFELRRSELDQAEAGVLSAQAEVTRIEERIHRFGWTDADLSEVAPRGAAPPKRCRRRRSGTARRP